MKSFDDMSAQRRAAHQLFDQLLDLRVEMIRRLVAPGFTPAQLLELDEALREHEALVDGAKEIVCISEVVSAAVPLHSSEVADTKPEKPRWPPQPKK